MSRVKKPGNKFVNTTKHDHTVTDASPVKRKKEDKTDYTKAGTLSSSLFLKYNMSYNAYRRKSKDRRDELRQEYMEDTGKEYFTKQEQQEAEAYDLLAEIGVPFSPTGEPLGIGWDN